MDVPKVETVVPCMPFEKALSYLLARLLAVWDTFQWRLILLSCETLHLWNARDGETGSVRLRPSKKALCNSYRHSFRSQGGPVHAPNVIFWHLAELTL